MKNLISLYALYVLRGKIDQLEVDGNQTKVTFGDGRVAWVKATLLEVRKELGN